MGSSEEGKPSKPEPASSPAPDQTNFPVYPDWAAMQAYYGPRIALPPFCNSAIASGHAPHPYMWGPPQHMMTPYGPYAAVFSHGGIYAHPGVPLAGTPFSSEAPGKSSGNADQGLLKNLKGYDGLAISIGDPKADNPDNGADQGLSRSNETEISTDASDGNTSTAGQNGKKRSRESTPTGKERQNSPLPSGEYAVASDMVVTPAGGGAGTISKLAIARPSSMGNLEMQNPSVVIAPNNNPQPCAAVPPGGWLQNDRELKRERRKQSNRESARRSRLRKQAEADELAVKVESLGAENVVLKTEITRLKENSEKLRLENAALTEKLKTAQAGKIEEKLLDRVDNCNKETDSTKNLLSRVKDLGSVMRNPDDEGLVYENTTSSSAKLHQLLGASPRTDAVAAG